MTLPTESSDAPDAVVVLTSVATADAAGTLVRALLERHLIACGTILPSARSLYRWEGEIADEPEVVVLLKTRRDRVTALKRAFDELHPYDVPELLSITVEDGARAYLAWLGAETATPAGSAPRGD
jgi:periplasmic divalent cation tolerance protein